MIRSEVRDHVAEVIIDNPPVNALPVKGWFELADTIRGHGRDPDVRALIIAANPELRGFQAGVDIKELAADPTHQSLIDVNRGCYECFAAVYDCEVPVIAAVHGFCLGGGVGIAGNADIVVAADDATFGLPEVDRGALGVATHLARLVPYHKMRAMFLTGSLVTAADLLAFGTAERVVPRAALLDTARELAQVIAAKSPLVIRRAKESLNAIDPVDVKRSYRFEQGFTFELNLWGDSDELRQAFVDKRDAQLDADPGDLDVTASAPVAEGLFTDTADGPRLLGGHCPRCGAWFFPKQWSFCRNPRCDGGPLDDAPLSSKGRLWSWTDNRYAPPPPYPAREPFEPYGVAAVELLDEQMVVLGQLARGTDVATLTLGTDMELVIEPLYEDADGTTRTVWKWRPAGGAR